MDVLPSIQLPNYELLLKGGEGLGVIRAKRADYNISFGIIQVVLHKKGAHSPGSVKNN